MRFPESRPRRLRISKNIRSLVQENMLSVNDLIYPIFVVHGDNIKKEIPSLSGQYHWSIDRFPEILKQVVEAKITTIMLFGVPSYKDAEGSENYDYNGIVQQAIRKTKELHSDLVVITDVCLCQYTDHGHCGVVSESGIIENDSTHEFLVKTALSHVESGADIIAPSGMMDGMIQALRLGLDSHGYQNISIMSYAVKYASYFYGPFREASATNLKGDRKTYQMDFSNSRDAIREALLDQDEGADFLMVKPAGAYLDIISKVKEATLLPAVAYQVSGEYAMIKTTAAAGLIDEKGVVLESMMSMKRAGSDIIVTYFAIDIAKWML